MGEAGYACRNSARADFVAVAGYITESIWAFRTRLSVCRLWRPAASGAGPATKTRSFTRPANVRAADREEVGRLRYVRERTRGPADLTMERTSAAGKGSAILGCRQQRVIFDGHGQPEAAARAMQGRARMRGGIPVLDSNAVVG